MAPRSSMREVGVVGLVGVVTALLLLSALQTTPRTTLLQRTTKLGEDKDWDVEKWSPLHMNAVAGQRVDRISAKGIWKSPSKAWAGIDDILPTGGQYGFQSAHYTNANQAELEGWMDHTERQMERIEGAFPKTSSKADSKEVKRLRSILDKQRAEIAQVKDELSKETHSMDKSAMQILSQKAAPRKAKQAARVYDDNAMWGEGIQGDIKSQGHHERWSAKASSADMDKYYTKLQGKNLKELAEHHQILRWEPTHYGSNAWMDKQFQKLDARDLAKAQEHKRILKQERYFKQHPFEHEHKRAWIKKMQNLGVHFDA